MCPTVMRLSFTIWDFQTKRPVKTPCKSLDVVFVVDTGTKKNRLPHVALLNSEGRQGTSKVPKCEATLKQVHGSRPHHRVVLAALGD